MENWWSKALTKEIAADQNGILCCTISDSDSYNFHEKHTKGAFLRKLKDSKNHQVQWETPYYVKILTEYLSEFSFSDKLILDFGCGDGRFTEFLLENGANKIICADFDYKTLLALGDYLDSTGNRDKVVLVHTDIENLPVAENSLDLTLAIGVLYYYNEQYENAILKIKSWLKPKSLLITSDPDMEGFLLRALMFDSLDEALTIFERRRFKEVKEQTDLRFRMFTAKESEALFSKCGFLPLNHRGISSFHNILRVLLLRGHITESEIDNNIKRIEPMFNFLHEEGRLFKHIVWKLQKP